ncbi:MAG: hypothetical protein R3B13_20385 [Polyangiaceae bacterium]
MTKLAALGLALALVGAGCSSEDSNASGSGGYAQLDSGSSGGSSGTAGSGAASGTSGAGGTAGVTGTGGGAGASASCDDKAKPCATDFGSLFSKSNGRADGTLVALVRPSDQQCAQPNSTHVTVQLSINGQVQRLVASVDGVATTTVQAPLIGEPYAEGWHLNQVLDYPTDLGVHSGDFSNVTMDQAVEFICSKLELGAPVSVYAYSDGTKPSSAHQIHRNDKYPDGAIVANPTSANPTYLLFRYPDQTF